MLSGLPHAAIRMKAFPSDNLLNAPITFQTRPWTAKDRPGEHMTIQVAPDDCTGCGVCVDVCPARSKEAVKVKAINMVSKVGSSNGNETISSFSWAFPNPTEQRSTQVPSKALN